MCVHAEVLHVIHVATKYALCMRICVCVSVGREIFSANGYTAGNLVSNLSLCTHACRVTKVTTCVDVEERAWGQGYAMYNCMHNNYMCTCTCMFCTDFRNKFTTREKWG